MSDTPLPFDQLGLSAPVLRAVQDNGYEQPSPIQSASIPPVLEGRDVLGQAQTGTGKTAAFALPLLSRLDDSVQGVQVLVLTPTRELAIQVAEAFQNYARHLKGFRVLPIYGGQSYDTQLRHLQRGVQVVVGTPGRVMDHMRRRTLKLDSLRSLVLDEADEMLRMGFLEDVDWILSHTPKARQVALFSATMPKEVKKVAMDHLRNPADIRIATRTTTAHNINQRYWLISGIKKLDALTRLLEVESFDGVLIFVRTKVATQELAEKLQARGFSAEALNGDMAQNQRERLVTRLRNGQLDIVIGTDVVARGLDVERISHVINYDIPHDTESYVHRIGRTGRAGRSGEAILFVARREQRMLRLIEQATRQPIQAMTMPTVADINQSRLQRFKARIHAQLAAKDLSVYQTLIDELVVEADVSANRIAAALVDMMHGKKSLLVQEQPKESKPFEGESREPRSRAGSPREDRSEQGGFNANPRFHSEAPSSRPVPLKKHPDIAMTRFQMAAGQQHGVKPSHIVGMICNEADIDRQYVGQVHIFDEISTVDLPSEMPKDILATLQNARLCGHRSEMQPMPREEGESGGDSSYGSKKSKKAPKKTKAKGQNKSNSKPRRKPR